MNRRGIRMVIVALAALGVAALYLRDGGEAAYEPTTFITSDDRTIAAIQFPARKDHAAVFVHGFGYTKETWIPVAGALQAAGVSGLAFDFRSRGESSDQEGGDPHLDVIGAVRHLESEGYERISIVGSDRGAKWVLRSLPELADAPIESIVLLSPHKDEDVTSHSIRKLFVVAPGDNFFYSTTLGLFNRAAEPKTLYEYRGKAHGEEMLADTNRQELVAKIVAFVTQ